MQTRRTRLVALIVTIVGCGQQPALVPTEPGTVGREGPSAALLGELPGATGSGHTIVAGELRTFSFTAQQGLDGTAQGIAQINNRMVNEMFQVSIDCLKVVDNIAIMSG